MLHIRHVTLAGVTCTGWWETITKYCTLGGLNYESVRRQGKKSFVVSGNDFPLCNAFYSRLSTALLKGAAHYSGSLCKPQPCAC